MVCVVSVYFPGNEVWYDFWTNQKYDVTGELNIQVIGLIDLSIGIIVVFFIKCF